MHLRSIKIEVGGICKYDDIIACRGSSAKIIFSYVLQYLMGEVGWGEAGEGRSCCVHLVIELTFMAHILYIIELIDCIRGMGSTQYA